MYGEGISHGWAYFGRIIPYRRSIIKIGYGYRMEKLEIPTKIRVLETPFLLCVLS